MSDIQGESILTTEGYVSQYQFSNGNVAYLIRNVDYKKTPEVDRYLVSRLIPIGAKGETYTADLSLEEAERRIFDFERDEF